MSNVLVEKDAENPWPSVLIWGLIGAGLVVAGRKVKPGVLSWVANTAGYSLLTKSIGTGVYSALSR
jgi:hypothetical protein